MNITRELVRAVRGRLEKNPDIPIDRLAAQLGAREADVLTCLPVAMRRRARLEDQLAIRESLAVLGLPTGPDPAGPEVGSIWFVADHAAAGHAGGVRAMGENPSGAAENPGTQGSLRFLDTEGGLLCHIPLGEGFSPMWRHYGVKDTPPKRRCGDNGTAHEKHCGSCRCSRGLPCCGGHHAAAAAHAHGAVI